MNIQGNPLTQIVSGAVGQLACNGPLEEVFEFIGVTNPEALTDMGCSPGGAFSALYEAFGYDPQFASAIGAAADAYTGNVAGAVSNAAEASGNEQAGQLFDLVGQIPM